MLKCKPATAHAVHAAPAQATSFERAGCSISVISIALIYTAGSALTEVKPGTQHASLARVGRTAQDQRHQALCELALAEQVCEDLTVGSRTYCPSQRRMPVCCSTREFANPLCLQAARAILYW